MLDQQEKFIIGLGNPGKNYINSRHNVGFQILQDWCKRYCCEFKLKSKFKCFYSEFSQNDILYRLFLPNTFMNNSGEAVRAIIDWYKISNEKIIIISDDIDLPLGKIRFRNKGGSGGHNGLKSIINNLNTQDFKRIRIGIGSPPDTKDEKKMNTISHVLGNFSKKEEILLDTIYKKVIEAIEDLNDKNESSIICSLNSYRYENN